jgi:hypothetical protein
MDTAPQIPVLIFGKGNAKVDKGTLTFSLPAGHTCPMAFQCMAKADRHTGRLTDGKNQKFRCFSASAEAAFPTVRKARWKNFETIEATLKAGGPQALTQLFLDYIPGIIHNVRIHVAGDFFHIDYFDAWAETARHRPLTTFYAYTKSLHLWKMRLGQLPPNFVLTASKGGRKDHLIEELNLRSAQVVFHPDIARKENLSIDHNDHLARSPDVRAFALLLHGPQAKNSEGSRATQRLRREKVKFGYKTPRRKSDAQTLPKLANPQPTSPRLDLEKLAA